MVMTMVAPLLSALLLAVPVASFAPPSIQRAARPNQNSRATLQLQAAALEAILFDCDGVLADTERDGHRLAFNVAFQNNGIDEEWGVERYGKLLEVGGGKERMTAHWNEVGWPSQIPEEGRSDKILGLHLQKTDIFMDLITEGKIPLRPGVLRLVDEAIANNVRLAVCSTSNEKAVANLVSTLMGPERAAKFQIFAGDMVKKKKPAPDVYLMAVDEMGLDKSKCAIIEDSHIGVGAAVAAGISCLVTKSSYTADEDFTGAKMIVEELGDDAETGVTLDTLTSLLDRAQDEAGEGTERTATAWDPIGHIEKVGSSWTGARFGEENINKPTAYTASETIKTTPLRGLGVEMKGHVEAGGASWTGARFGDDSPNMIPSQPRKMNVQRGIGVEMKGHVESGGASWTGARFGNENPNTIASQNRKANNQRGIGVEIKNHVESGGASWTGARFGDDAPEQASSQPAKSAPQKLIRSPPPTNKAIAQQKRGIGVEIKNHIESGGASWTGARFGNDKTADVANKAYAYSASETIEFQSKNKRAGTTWDPILHTEVPLEGGDKDAWSGARFGDENVRKVAPTPSQWHE